MLASIAGTDGRVASVVVGAIVWITTFAVAKARIQPRPVGAEQPPQDAQAAWLTWWPAAVYAAVVITSGMAIDNAVGFDTRTSTAVAVVPLLALGGFALARRCNTVTAAAILALGLQAGTRAALFAVDMLRTRTAGTVSAAKPDWANLLFCHSPSKLPTSAQVRASLTQLDVSGTARSSVAASAIPSPTAGTTLLLAHLVAVTVAGVWLYRRQRVAVRSVALSLR